VPAYRVYRYNMCNGTQRFGATASFCAFAAFGLFWGTWGAALPALQATAGLDDAALGTALLFVGLGAAPAMVLSGRAVDRFGARTAGPLLVAMALAGVLTAWAGRDLVTLAATMALVGCMSGAADVGENALAGLAEQRSGRRIITTSHAVFSTCVVFGSLGAGALRAAGVGTVAVFAATGAVIALAGAAVFVLGDGRQPSAPGPSAGRTVGRRVALPFVVVGLIGALGFATENAHQSWSAIFLSDELGAGPALTAVAPATFAAFAAATRFAAGRLTRVPDRALLIGGAGVALAGTLLVSASPGVPVALAGLALAATGTSVLFPTLLSTSTRHVPPGQRGRATSAVATTSYLGFVLGPVYVGALAGAAGLRAAMVGVALLAGAFALLAPPVTRRAAAAVARRQEIALPSNPPGTPPPRRSRQRPRPVP
jgi:predicted MFS family arabinose efflux permease